MRPLQAISRGIMVLMSLFALFTVASAQGNNEADYACDEEDFLIPGTIPEFEEAPYGVLDAGSPEALRLKEQAEQYYALADERQRAAARSYRLILTATMHYSVTVGGQVYSPMDLSNMTEDQRQELARAYLQQQGYWVDYITLRKEQDAFLAEQGNAEFAQYKQWQVAVYDYEGGPHVYWQDYLQRNPKNAQAQRYYESVRDESILNTDRDRGLTSLDAYMVAKGIPGGAFDAIADVSWYQVIDPVGILNTTPQPSASHRC